MKSDDKIPRAIADIIEDARRERRRPATLVEREVGHPLPHSQRDRDGEHDPRGIVDDPRRRDLLYRHEGEQP